MAKKQLRVISGSKAELLMSCPGVVDLPHNERSTNAGATRGSSFDSFCQVLITEGSKAALAVCHDDIRQMAELFLAGGGEAKLRSILRLDQKSPTLLVQPAFALEVDGQGARYLGDNIDRNYNIEEGWMPGTADFVSYDRGLLVLVDIKTGHTPVSPPEDNWQLKFLSTCLARLKGDEFNEIAAYIFKVDQDGEVWCPEPARWSVMDVDAFGHQLKKKLASRQLVVGDHCRYCEAVAYCPAQVASAQALVESSDRLAVLTPEKALELYDRAKAVEGALDVVWNALKAYVQAEGGEAKHDDRKLYLKSKTIKTLKSEPALDWLGKNVSPDAAIRCSKTSNEALKANLSPADYKRAIAALEANGGFVSKECLPGLHST